VNIEFLEPAQTEFDEAIGYFENEQPGLGDRFRVEVQRALIRISNFPESYQKLSRRTRRCLVAVFPYGIIYEHRPEINKILIVAIAHLHRKPGYWSDREI